MISLILKMPSATQVITLPEQASPQAKLTLDEIGASYSFNAMPNSREQLSQKLLDILCDDSAETFTFPPSWQVMWMGKLVDIEVTNTDTEGNETTKKGWEVITNLQANFINFLNDDNEGNRPNAVFEPHRFMGLPPRF